MTTDEAVQFRWVESELPPEAFDTNNGLYITTSREATEETYGSRRHIFEPNRDDDNRIYSYDSICEKIPGLKGKCLIVVPGIELILSEHIGSQRVCHRCKTNAPGLEISNQDALESFVDAGGEWPIDEPPTIVFGDEPPVDVSYHLDMSVDVCLPESWWSRYVREPLADLDVDE